MDAVIRHTICKHIHLVVRHNKVTSHADTQVDTDAIHVKANHSLFLQTVEHEKQPSDLAQMKQRVLEQLCSLTAQIKQCTSIEGLLAAEKHIIVAKGSCRLIRSSIDTDFICKSKEPANKKAITQQPFYSTKNRTRKPTIKLAKPTHKEREMLQTALLSKDTLYKCEPTQGSIDSHNKHPNQTQAKFNSKL